MMLNRKVLNQLLREIFYLPGLRMMLNRRFLNQFVLSFHTANSLRMMLNRRNCFRPQKTKETALL